MQIDGMVDLPGIAGIGAILFGFWLVLELGLEFETVWIAVALVAALVVIGLELFYEMPKGAKIVCSTLIVSEIDWRSSNAAVRCGGVQTPASTHNRYSSLVTSVRSSQKPSTSTG